MSVDALVLARLKPELKMTHVENNVPRTLTVTARTIFPPPHKAQIVSEGESQRRHLDTGVDLLANTIDGARTANSLASWTDKDVCHGPCATRSVCIGVVRFHTRTKSLVANLSAKRQLSVAKLSAKRIFSLAKRDFLVANGRMAADFSSPVLSLS